MAIKRKLLFGGDLKWNADDLTASDDRVRGGKSQSYLTPLAPTHTSACFHGHLDTTALGSAGFASQRTASDTLTWDLSSYDGISLRIEKSSLSSSDKDGNDHDDDNNTKVYTFILKDSIPETYVDESTGRTRDKATVSWEFDFRVPKQASTTGEKDEEVVVSIPWRDFKPTYRGKEVKDAGRIDLKGVRRMSLMMRSFFGTQEGDFSLTLRSIEAVSMNEDEGEGRNESANEEEGRGSDSETEDSMVLDKRSRYGHEPGATRQQQGWLSWIFGRCWKL